MSDTGGLRYNSSNKEAFQILGEMVDFVDPWTVSSNIWESVPINQLKLLSEVLNEMILVSDGKIAFLKVTNDQLDQYKLEVDNIDSFINYARSIDSVEVAVKFRELSTDKYKISLRSKGLFDCSLVAHNFGGGGHKNAAGFVFEGKYEDGIKVIENIFLSSGVEK